MILTHVSVTTESVINAKISLANVVMNNLGLNNRQEYRLYTECDL